jgi:hypothetical protein
MSNIEQQRMEFKFGLAKEWLMLQTHKWRKPKWVKFPSAMLEDMRWIKLSDRAKAAWPSVLVIASEHHECRLPDPDLLFLRLRLLGHCPRLDSFSALIDEYIQCGFVLKTTPELQSYRDTEIQKEKSPPDLNDGCPIKEVVGEILQPIAQPLFRDTRQPWQRVRDARREARAKLGAFVAGYQAEFVPPGNLPPRRYATSWQESRDRWREALNDFHDSIAAYEADEADEGLRWSTPQIWEITGTAEGYRIRTEFEKRPESFRVVLEGHGDRVTAP